MSRLPPQPGERIDRGQAAHVHVRRQAGRRLRGRHDRLRALRLRAAHVQPLVQVPPPARRAVRLRPVRELAGPDRRAPGRARVRRAGERRPGRRAHEREARPRLRRDARHRHRRRPVHAAGLLLQDVHPPAATVAAVREGAALRRGPRRAAEAPGAPRVAHGVPPPPLRRAGDRRRDRRPGGRAAGGRAGRRRGAVRRGHGARRRAAARGRSLPCARPGRPRPGRRGGDPLERAGARVLRRSRPGLAGQHAAPGARRAPHRRDRARSSSRSSSPTTTCPA